MKHLPVLTKEVLEYLDIKPGDNVIDGTIGQAGHTLLFLEKNAPDGKVLGIDLDESQIENAKATTQTYQERVFLVRDSYSNIKNIIERENIKPVNGMLLDLGYSSWQLEQSTKGFSFLKDEVLDMRYDFQNTLTAQKIVNEWSEHEIVKILKEYGEEKCAKKIASQITKQRKNHPIETTFQLKEIIESVTKRNGRIHPATRTFQALRITVNHELENLQNVLPDTLEVLAPSGRLVIISFHSLEDRIIKHFFRDKEQEGIITILTKKPIEASQQELSVNPRARSAKLRAFIKN